MKELHHLSFIIHHIFLTFIQFRTINKITLEQIQYFLLSLHELFSSQYRFTRDGIEIRLFGNSLFPFKELAFHNSYFRNQVCLHF